jgi:hypothetical protein
MVSPVPLVTDQSVSAQLWSFDLAFNKKFVGDLNDIPVKIVICRDFPVSIYST